MTFTVRPSKSLSRLPLTLALRITFSSASHSASSMSHTASASLKNTIFPSTSINDIWYGSSSFSEDLPKRWFFCNTSCSRIFWIVSFNLFVSALSLLICSVCLLSCSDCFSIIASKDDLSSLFSCSRLNSAAIIISFYRCDYSRNPYFTPI